MSLVFVVDTNKRPVNPIHPGCARRLLTEGKAAIWRRYPFTVILKQALPSELVEPLRLKLDPGSKTTGLALVYDTTGQVVAASEITHRGQEIRDKLLARRAKQASTSAAWRSEQGDLSISILTTGPCKALPGGTAISFSGSTVTVIRKEWRYLFRSKRQGYAPETA